MPCSVMFRQTIPFPLCRRKPSRLPPFLFSTLLLILGATCLLRVHSGNSTFLTSFSERSVSESPKAPRPVGHKKSLRYQLRRIEDAENWRVLGDIQTTGEDIYRDRKTRASFSKEANVAFFLQISSGNIPLVPRLLSRIWHPGNIYCLHFDTKIPSEEINLFTTAIKSNQHLKNVFILPSAPVTYAGISMLLNTIESMSALLRESKDWDYYINLSGSDYPLISATAIRRLLGRPDVLGSSINFIHFSPSKNLWNKLAAHRLGRLHFDMSLGFHMWSNEELVETSSQHPVFRPGNLRIQVAKGEAWVIAHRKFCEIAAHGNVARRLLTLFANMQSTPEHFFQTLAWNHKDLNDTIARHSFREVVWSHGGYDARQHPFYLDERSRSGSWSMWPVLAHSPNFFARKFRIPDSSLLDHIDVHKSGATDKMPNMTAVSESFGLVKNRLSCIADIHSEMSKRYIMSCLWRGWREKGCKEKQEDLCIGDFLEPPR